MSPDESPKENPAPAAEPAKSEPAVATGHAASDHPNRRQSTWAACYEALNYVLGIERSKLRTADKTTDILLGLAILSIVLLSFAPSEAWQVPLAFGCDVICLIVVLSFLGNRMGILRTLSQKQAVLVWDIVMGALILGVLVAVNSMLFIRTLLHVPGSM
ncbi:MAG: hypothetical protein C5B53_12190 [Candidatus Melainabacteria bacterium]|nr:MAG: hypothetical protein C5B53_12190 [Candidatus Melainabacteria bacterium]